MYTLHFRDPGLTHVTPVDLFKTSHFKYSLLGGHPQTSRIWLLPAPERGQVGIRAWYSHGKSEERSLEVPGAVSINIKRRFILACVKVLR